MSSSSEEEKGLVKNFIEAVADSGVRDVAPDEIAMALSEANTGHLFSAMTWLLDAIKLAAREREKSEERWEATVTRKPQTVTEVERAIAEQFGVKLVVRRVEYDPPVVSAVLYGRCDVNKVYAELESRDPLVKWKLVHELGETEEVG